MAERKAGSERGRPAIDWEAAFAYYASLPDSDRSYQAISDQFGVSVRTVETHGREGGWKTRLRKLKQDAAMALNEELTGRQLESLTNALKLAEATYTRYAQQLQAGTVKVTPSDLARMVALQQQITDTVSVLSHAAANEHPDTEADEKPDESAHQLEVLRALQDAGALDQILNLLRPTLLEGEAEPTS